MHVETRTARNSAETLKLQLHRMDIYSYNDFVTCVHQGQVLNPVHSLLMGAQTLDTQVAVAL